MYRLYFEVTAKRKLHIGHLAKYHIHFLLQKW